MKSFGRYLKEVRVEMGKVVWPSLSELIGTTVIVLVLITLLTAFLFGVDSGLKWAAHKLYAAYSVLR